jgi:hypothetical protein
LSKKEACRFLLARFLHIPDFRDVRRQISNGGTQGAWTMQNRKTGTNSVYRTFSLLILTLFLANFALDRVEAMGTETVGRPAPLANQPDWAPGLRDTLDNANRVYSVLVNGNETFYYRGTIPEMNNALAKYGDVEQKGLRIIVQQGMGQTKMLDGTTEVAYDWSINVPSGLYLQAARLGQVKDPVLVPVFTVCLSGREEPGLPQISFPKGIPVLDAEALKKAGIKATGAEKENGSATKPSSPEFVGATEPASTGADGTAGAKSAAGNSEGTLPSESQDTKPARPGMPTAFAGATEPIASGSEKDEPADPRAMGFSGEQAPITTPVSNDASSESDSKEASLPVEGKRKPVRSIAALFDEEIPPEAKSEKESFSPVSEPTAGKILEPKPLATPRPTVSASPPPRADGPLTPGEQKFLIRRVNSVLKRINLLSPGVGRTNPASKSAYGVSPLPRTYGASTDAARSQASGRGPKSSIASLPPSRFPQMVSASGARTQPDGVTRSTARAIGGHIRAVSPTTGEILAPSPLQPTPTEGENDRKTPGAPTSTEPTAPARLTIHPLFSATQDGPLFRVDYTHAGPEELSVAQALKEERLVLDGRELAPLQVATDAGPDRLTSGQSWRHTIMLSNFLPTTSQPGGNSASPRQSRGKIALESGEHTLSLKFAGQISPPLRFEWAGGPLMTE